MMAQKMMPRKYAKLPWIREATGSRCAELANKWRDEQIWDAVYAAPSAPGDILTVIPRAAEVNLRTEFTSERGVRTRQQITERIEHGQLAHIPREDGQAHLARAVVVPRLYGRRSEIIAQVQAEILRRDGVQMSASWIEKCWDDFCVLQNTLSAEKD